MVMVMVFLIMYFIGFMVFCLNSKHLLLMLLSLEFIMLSLYMNLYSYFLNFYSEMYFLMIFLTMGVCEGALGLSILVALIRTHGNDYFSSMNLC